MRKRDGQIVGTAFCESCNKTTAIMLVDGGFAYEFWGAKGYKEEWSFECSECGEEVDQDSVVFYEEDVPEPDPFYGDGPESDFPDY
jgi:hypothetical protein